MGEFILRLKNIKRVIVEQVEKEGTWIDSIRGLAGSTFLGSRPEAILKEGDVLLGGSDADGSVEVDIHVEDDGVIQYRIQIPLLMLHGQRQHIAFRPENDLPQNLGIQIISSRLMVLDFK